MTADVHVDRATKLRWEVAEQIRTVIEQAELPLVDVYVGWSPVLDVARCPAGYRAQGEEGWGFPGWSPALAGGAAGRAALVHHLDVHRGPLARPDAEAVPLPDPVGTVRDWMRAAVAGRERSPVGEWVAETGRSGDRATLAATAATASRWLGGFVRVLGWPLPGDLRVVADDRDNHTGLQWRGRWRPGHPGGRRSGVTVASRPDAIRGRPGGRDGYALVVHRPIGPDDGDLVQRAAFEAAAAALASGATPDGVTVTLGDTGERAHVDVDAGLLEQGVAGIVEVVRQRARAATDTGFDDARPSVACRRCPAAGECPAGQASLAAAGRWNAGLPQVAPDHDGGPVPVA